jgi:hypothetical protein
MYYNDPTSQIPAASNELGSKFAEQWISWTCPDAVTARDRMFSFSCYAPGLTRPTRFIVVTGPCCRRWRWFARQTNLSDRFPFNKE